MSDCVSAVITAAGWLFTKFLPWLSDLMPLAAAFAALWWFWHQGLWKPRINLSQKVESFPIGDAWLLKIRVRIENTGHVRFELPKLTFRVWQTVPPKVETMTSPLAEPHIERDDAVMWKELATGTFFSPKDPESQGVDPSVELKPQLRMVLRPGELEEFAFSAIISESGVDVVEVVSQVPRPGDSPSGQLAWGAYTFVDLRKERLR